MARLIDANRALEIVRNQGIAHPNAYHLTNYATIILREAPTVDAVEVVRCRDCKHRIYVDISDEIGAVGGCELFGVAMHYDCFCSYGERKEGDD